MKVFLNPPTHLSHGIHRVADALTVHAPTGVTVVDRLQDADFALFHVIGWGSLDGEVSDWISAGKPYGLVQYCLRTTENPDAYRWSTIWEKAALTWSYYDLTRYCTDVSLFGVFGDDNRRFYFAPMGVDATVFHPRLDVGERDSKVYDILTSGYIADTESVGECALAVARVGGRMAHLGPSLGLGQHVHSVKGITDSDLAAYYRACRYVAGLRRIEGFEMPALEGLMCGARPILFAQPHYADWFGSSAVYVPEVAPDVLVDYLVGILRREPEPVTLREHNELIERFSWPVLTRQWWARLNAEMGGAAW